MAETSITQWIKNFKNGEYDNSTINCQIKAGWYDWFCKDSSLQKKTQKLGEKLIQISSSKKFNNDTSYVFFKNNCPCNGSLYDDFRICDIASGDVLFTITPCSGHKVDNGRGNVWGQENDFQEPLFEGSWLEIKKWFLNE